MRRLGLLQAAMIHPRLPPIVTAAAETGIRSVMVVSLGLVLVLAMFEATNAVYQPLTLDNLYVRGGVALLVIALLMTTLWLATRSQPVRPSWFLPASLMASFALHLAYGLPLELEYTSDFAVYWGAAQTLASQANLDTGGNVHFQRAIPFLWPLVELFGPSRAALVCMNALMLCIVQVAGYDMLRRSASHQTAQAFTILWIFAPEPLFAAAIPSHDVTGAAMFAVALWLNARFFLANRGAAPRLRWTLLSGLALGATLYLLDMARGSGTGLLMLASGAGILGVIWLNRWTTQGQAAQDTRPAMLAVQLTVASVVFVILLGLTTAAGLRIDPETQLARNLRAYVPQQTALSDGTYGFVMRFHNAFNRDLMDDPARFAEQAKSIARSEFLERPVARLWSTLERAPRLARLGQQQFLYLSKASEQPRWLLALAATYNAHYVLMLSLLALYGLTQLLRAPLRAPVLLQQSAMLAAIILALLTMRENQPRYIFAIWMVASALAATGLSLPGFTARQLPASILRGVGHVVLAIMLTCGLAFAAWGLLTVSYTPEDGRVLTQWTLHGDETLPGQLESKQTSLTDVLNTNVNGTPRTKGVPHMVNFQTLSLKLAFVDDTAPGGRVAASKQVCSKDSAPLSLTFQYYTPYKHLKQQGAFTFTVLADGREIWRTQLPNATQPVRVTTPAVIENPGDCVELRFQLESNRGLLRGSWTRASKVEIFYPHLTKAPAAEAQ